ncbi:MAG TPA: RNA polymerase sigma factor [Candidatus Paceibacterota bacterium]|nr:RNA polymerase sigma factor [Candidatus Paceibacterota bacterium]
MSEKSEKEIRQLIKKAQKGDAEAFGLVYDNFLDRIYRFIYLKVSNREEAQDLAQQAFMKAWEAINGFEDEGLPFSSWLYRIARNLVIDFYRVQKNNVSLDEGIGIMHPDDLEERMFKSQKQEEIRKALRDLTDEQRDIIILRFVDDLSYKEIGKITKKNPAALRILQHRAINKLRKSVKTK